MYWILCVGQKTPKEVESKHFNTHNEAQKFLDQLQQEGRYPGMEFKIREAWNSWSSSRGA